MDGTGGCEQICVNSVGSFQCQCEPGFMLTEDTLTCAGARYSMIKSSSSKFKKITDVFIHLIKFFQMLTSALHRKRTTVSRTVTTLSVPTFAAVKAVSHWTRSPQQHAMVG